MVCPPAAISREAQIHQDEDGSKPQGSIPATRCADETEKLPVTAATITGMRHVLQTSGKLPDSVKNGGETAGEALGPPSQGRLTYLCRGFRFAAFLPSPSDFASSDRVLE